MQLAAFEEFKKKMLKESDGQQQRIASLQEDNDKANKSKKKLQSEVEDLTVALDNQRTQYLQMEKKHRKFDQSLAEEKAVSER